MTVWIVNPFDNLPQEGTRAQRYWLMARAFAKAGWRVVYWTGDFSHATKKRRVFGGTRLDGADAAISLRMLPTLPYAKNICLGRLASHRKLARDFARAAREEASTAGKPSIVVASMPPLGLCGAAMKAARETEATFIADVQDAWPETFERVVPPFALAALGLYRKARDIYRGADAISAVARRYALLAEKYGTSAPREVFGHCIEMHSQPPFRDNGAGALRLAYIGNMSLSYDLATLVETVAATPDVSLDVAGGGPDRERLEKLASGAGNIRFHGYLDETGLREMLSRCDAGVVPMFPESAVGVPGKLADYAAAGLAVIESLGGETRELVESSGVGVHYTAGDATSLAAAIARIRSLRPSREARLAFAARFDAAKVMPAFVLWAQERHRRRNSGGKAASP